MHTWAKRGLQTAVVTGGLFVIGSGIASASENVTPAAPVDLPAAGNVSGVVSNLTGGETPVKAVPVAQVLDSGALSAPVKTVQNTVGQVTSKANPASLTEIRGFSGNLLDQPGQLTPQDAPALPVRPNDGLPRAGVPNLPAVPAPLAGTVERLPVLPTVPGPTSLGGPAEQTLPLGPAANARDLVAPVLAQVTRAVLSGGAAAPVSALNLPAASTLLGATDVPSIPFGLGGPGTQDAPALPSVPNLGVPNVNLPAGNLTNAGNLANANLPEVSTLRGVLPLNGVPSLQDQPAVPALPGLAGVTLPNLPRTQDAPAGLSLPNLPKVPFLPEAPQLPGTGALPQVPQVSELAGMPAGAAQTAVGGFVRGAGLPTA